LCFVLRLLKKEIKTLKYIFFTKKFILNNIL
jgi:hypothetical protein